MSPLEAARGLELGDFGDLLETERIVGNLHRAMAEISGRAFDGRQAWEDMLELNGGQPLTCHA